MLSMHIRNINRIHVWNHCNALIVYKRSFSSTRNHGYRSKWAVDFMNQKPWCLDTILAHRKSVPLLFIQCHDSGKLKITYLCNMYMEFLVHFATHSWQCDANVNRKRNSGTLPPGFLNSRIAWGIVALTDAISPSIRGGSLPLRYWRWRKVVLLLPFTVILIFAVGDAQKYLLEFQRFLGSYWNSGNWMALLHFLDYSAKTWITSL